MNLTDFTSPSFYKDPYQTYKVLRQVGKLVRVAPNTLFAGHYETVTCLLNNQRMGKSFLDAIAVKYGSEACSQPVFQMMSRMFIMLNPPAHTRLRALLGKAFSSRGMNEIRVVANDLAHGLINNLETQSKFDLVADFARPLPIHIICRLLDIPAEDGLLLAEETAVLARLLDATATSEETLTRANVAVKVLEFYFNDIINDRAGSVGKDLISMLISSEAEGQRLTREEIISNIILLFVAGHETTSNMIGNTLVALYKNPSQLRILRDNMSLIPNAITECVRFDSSVQFTARTALDDVVVGNALIEKGTLVYLVLGSANRDDAAYMDADILDVQRNFVKKVISFGGGIHHCLGAHLATIELQTAITSLIHRFPRLELLGLDNLQWLERGNLRGLVSLFARQI